MNFLCVQVCYWGVGWAIVCQFIATHGDAHSVCLFLLGYYVTYHMAVGDLDVLSNLIYVYEETCVCPLYVSDP